MDDSIIFIAAFFLFAAVSIGVILVLWIAMPFSVFGLKALLKKSIDEQAETNRLLRSIIEARRKDDVRIGSQDASGAQDADDTAGRSDAKDRLD
ncbi:MAG: hypothetical protein AABY51_06765 [Deltaproteobacteria bacterium]